MEAMVSNSQTKNHLTRNFTNIEKKQYTHYHVIKDLRENTNDYDAGSNTGVVGEYLSNKKNESCQNSY
jgi:hypothetical protein